MCPHLEAGQLLSGQMGETLGCPVLSPGPLGSVWCCWRSPLLTLPEGPLGLGEAPWAGGTLSSRSCRSAGVFVRGCRLPVGCSAGPRSPCGSGLPVLLAHAPAGVSVTYMFVGRRAEACCPVAQLCPALCDPVDCSSPGFPVLHQLPEFAPACVH